MDIDRQGLAAPFQRVASIETRATYALLSVIESLPIEAIIAIKKEHK